MGEQLLTTSDIARRLNLSPERIRQLARAGALVPASVTTFGQRLFTLAEVERYEHRHAAVEASR
jgi:DNA-binding transcriptional MerR regulator